MRHGALAADDVAGDAEVFAEVGVARGDHSAQETPIVLDVEEPDHLLGDCSVPITPATLATTAKACLDAGAAMLHMHIRDAQGRHSLDVEGYREAQRVRQFGFTATEYDRTKAEYLSQLESSYENRNKIKNDQFGDEYRDNYLGNEPIPGIETEYQIMSQLIPMLPVDMINEYAKDLISDNDTNLVVTLYEQEKDGLYTGHAPNYCEVCVRAEDLHNKIIDTKIVGIDGDALIGELT